jgi:2-oxo-4-hydroxy-4-carboxy-5-ureidoimidazoline decarboxylase
MRPDIAALNAMAPAEFVAALAGIFEHSPWIAQTAAARRPFAGIDSLHAAMVDIVARSGAQAQLDLLRAHPMLARKASLTAESESEQARHGLQSLAEAEAAEMEELNRAYFDRFGFPFIIAVRGQRDRGAILAALRRRLEASEDAERAEALTQVAAIARYRLEDRFA